MLKCIMNADQNAVFTNTPNAMQVSSHRKVPGRTLCSAAARNLANKQTFVDLDFW